MNREIAETRCLCGMLLWDRNAAQEVLPGSYVVCIYCGQVLRLNDQLAGEPITLSSLPAHLQRELGDMQRVARVIGPELRKRHQHRRPPPRA